MSEFCCVTPLGGFQPKMGNLAMLCLQLLLRTHFDLTNKQDISQKSREPRGKGSVSHLTLHWSFCSMTPLLSNKRAGCVRTQRAGILPSQKPREDYVKIQIQLIFKVNGIQTKIKCPFSFIVSFRGIISTWSKGMGFNC